MVLFEKILADKFKPEVIIGVARGGWIPGRLLADFFLLRETANVKVELYHDIEKRGETPIITQEISTSLEGKRVLLVDDVADSGKSLQVVIKEFERLGIENFRCATIYYKPMSIIKPDYYVIETTSWVVFGWERFEFISQFVKLEMNKSRSLEEIKSELKQIGIPPGDVEIYFKVYKDSYKNLMT